MIKRMSVKWHSFFNYFFCGFMFHSKLFKFLFRIILLKISSYHSLNPSKSSPNRGDDLWDFQSLGDGNVYHASMDGVVGEV